jgi:hypothetical protein
MMMEDEDKITNNFHTRLVVIEKDLSQLTGFLSKLETTMDKLYNTLSSLRETIILHDLKLSNHEKIEVNDTASIKDINKRLDILEQFKWYSMGVIAILVLLMPIIYKFILKI